MPRNISYQSADVKRRHGTDVKHQANDKRGLDAHPDRIKPVKLEASMMPVPDWMSAEQEKIFRELRDTILLNEIAATTDRHSLALLCTQYTSYMDVAEVISRDGYTVDEETKDGRITVRPHPLLPEKGRLFSSIKQLMTEFGMTPNSRRKAQRADPEAPENTQEGEWDDLLN